jgi:hypothetical protein
MINKLLIITLISTLPVLVSAEEKANTAEKPAAKEHHMQNTDPSAKKEAVPEHTMRNDNPAPKPADPKPEHVMKNN